MTRFARAKGSKASNEKLPEQATSWSEMKRELLNKNKDLEEKKNREKAMQQRQANYQAFLQEKEDEDVKNISWADFPEARDTRKTETSKKRKFIQIDDTEVTEPSKSVSKNIKLKVERSSEQSVDTNSEDSDEEFSALKLQIDKVLDNQSKYNSDSDAPPEEASIKEKPQEIIVKKAKKRKQKLQILINQKDKSSASVKEEKSILRGKVKESNMNIKKLERENLSERDKKKIEKKHERHRKQVEKKKAKKHEAKSKKSETVNDSTETKIDINGSVTEKDNLSELEAKKLEKKLERRKKQKEKKLKKRLEGGLINTTENTKKDEVLSEKDLANIQKKKERRARQAEKRKKFREAKALAAESAEANKNISSEKAANENNGYNNYRNNNNNIDLIVNGNDKFRDTFKANPGLTHINRNTKQINTKEKKVKLKEYNVERKKAKPETWFINGKSIEIDYVDGFPVKKDDADRLKGLRKEMISKGLPRSEINISLKLERRRAEKALTRERKNVCFNCRKSGHNLSECPALDNDQMAQTSGTGICFKCGSTEHTHFECKVVKGLDYKFATCFICKEQGHIARQCPDNQRGLYPKGGSCKICGDVTHLKKDCPKFHAQQAQLQTSLSIETLDNRNPDDFTLKGEAKNILGPVKKLNKIKF